MAHPFSMDDGPNWFMELLNDARVSAVMVSLSREILYCNDHFLLMAGWTLPEICGKSWSDIFVPANVEDRTVALADLLEGGPSAWHQEHAVLTRSGKQQRIRWNNIVLRDSSGSPVAIGSIGEDMAERTDLQRQLLEVSGRERRQLQSELHDGLGQELFVMSILADSLATAAKRDGSPLMQDLEQLSSIANHAIDNCRGIARGLAPLSDVQGGLVQALQRLIVRPKGWQGPALELTIRVTAPMRLSAEALEHVYRIAQEGLTNAIKHAGAQRISLRLDVKSESVGLEIADDGTGVSANAAAPPGIGLKLMRYRADLLHGDLRIRRRSEGGTRLFFSCKQPV